MSLPTAIRFCRFPRTSFLPRSLTGASPCSSRRRGVLARSYPVRTVIQFSFEVVPLLSSLGTFFAIHNPLIWSQQFEKAQTNRKSRFTQHLAERIEIPFRSKKLCKSALLQSLSLFVRRTVNRLKTGGRRRRLVAAEALAADQAHHIP